MTQNKTRSLILLKEILTDLHKDIGSYSKPYTLPNMNETFLYPNQIERILHMAEDAIIKKEYNKALTYYKYVQQYINEKKHGFDMHISLLNEILYCIKTNKNKIINILKEKETLAIEDVDEETYSICKKYEISLVNPSMNDVCREVNHLIENHFYIASASILDIIEDKDKLHKYTHIIEYLRAKSHEYCMEEFMSSECENIKNALLKQVSICCDEENYDRAERLAKEGSLKTNHPDFCYYLGKIYYKRTERDKALEYFLSYKKIGVKKYPKVQPYIYNIYKKNNPRLAMEEMKNALEIESLIKDFQMILFEYIASYEFVKKINKSDYEDFKPGIQKILMTEEDFLKRD